MFSGINYRKLKSSACEHCELLLLSSTEIALLVPQAIDFDQWMGSGGLVENLKKNEMLHIFLCIKLHVKHTPHIYSRTADSTQTRIEKSLHAINSMM